MYKIQRNKSNFQSLIDWIVFVFRLGTGTLPPVEIKRASFPMPINRERLQLERARAAFELKKLGRAN